MSFEQKAGSFALFKNDRKEKDSHPDYKGDGMDLNGQEVWVSAWLKDGKNGKFMSCSMQAKEQRSAAQQDTTPRKQDAPEYDIPF